MFRGHRGSPRVRVTSPERLACLLSDRLAERGDRGRAITLAQLLEDVLAYPGVRSELGLAGKGEYDLAMLGLLTHRSLLQVDPAVAAAARRELESPEPGLGFSDDFADRLLRLRPGTPPVAGAESMADGERAEDAESSASSAGSEDAAAPAAGSKEAAVPVADPEDAAAPAAGPEDAAVPAAVPLADMPAPAAEPGGGNAAGIPTDDAPDASEPGAASCRACAAPLPRRDGVRYCPRCGADQAETRCLACGELLEREWRFCPRCGRGLEAS